ncbi:MAG TPA: hypothetical protein PKY25_00120 [Bacilli bacterium]|nr:hypothetical protein [Bacilli bacterium]
MNQEYLIPANAKRGMLIFNVFRTIDLIIAGVGTGITIIAFLIVQPNTLWSAVLVLAPVAIAAFLVTPFAHYHNVLCVLINIYEFLTTQQKYKWKGWCSKDEYSE